MDGSSLLLSPAYAIPLLAVLFSVYYYLLRSRSWRRRSSLPPPPPGPTTLPFIGNLHQLGNDPLLHRSLQRLSNKHGPVMQLQLGSIPTLIVSSAEYAREIFKSHDLTFSSRPPMYAAKKLGYGHSDIAFAPYGEYWREIRKIAALELLSARRVQSFKSVREEEVAILLDDVIAAARSSSSSSTTVDLSQRMIALSNNLVCRVAFGKKWDSHDDDDNEHDDKKNRIDVVMKETQALLGEINLADFYPWLGWLVNKLNGVDKRLDDNFRKIDKFFNELIQEHRDNIRGGGAGIEQKQSLENEDIIDVLLRIQSDTNQTIRLTDNQIKGILVDIFVAGTDTTAATVVWTMAELMRNPAILKRAQDELRQQSFNRNNNNTTPSQMILESDLLSSNLPYFKMIIKESFRLHPPVPLLIPRETTQPCEIGGRGFHVPARTRVFVNAWAISRDPDCWVDPNRFDPERFSDEKSSAVVVDFRGQDFGLVPFGAGRRICPGMNFAVVMVELVLANLLSGFDWELPSGEVVDMEESVGLTSHKKTPLVLVAWPRYSRTGPAGTGSTPISNRVYISAVT